MRRVLRHAHKFLGLFFAISTFIFMLHISDIPVSAATPTRGITAVSNTQSGIKVYWNKESLKTGYYIYRKADTATRWTRVKQITRNTTTSWTDTNTTNGKKYVYKVYSYKGSRTTSNSSTRTIYRLTKPKLTATRAGSTSIRVKAYNKSATGFLIKYSRNKDMSNSSSIYVKGRSLDKTISSLKRGAKYYIKVRAYKTVNDKRYYSTYSDVRSVVTYYRAYTKNTTTRLYVKPDSGTRYVEVRYMTALNIYNAEKSYSSGEYRKVSYKGKYYYVWIAKGTSKFTMTKNPYNYDNVAENKYAQEIIDKAVYIFKNVDTIYSHNTPGTLNSAGKMQFDCSGFVSYVINKVMKKYVPVYNVTANIEKLSKTNVVFNNGFKHEFRVKTVCTGKMNFSLLKPGDILFYKLPNLDSTKNPNHCIMYLGNNQFIHCTKTAGKEGGVEILPFMSSYANNNYFVKAIRFTPASATELKPINEEYVTIDYFNVYDNVKCISNNNTDTVTFIRKKNLPVKVLYTSAKSAYIEYGNGKRGFVWLGGTKKFDDRFAKPKR